MSEIPMNPHTLTDAQKEELRAADPAAYGLPPVEPAVVPAAEPAALEPPAEPTGEPAAAVVAAPAAEPAAEPLATDDKGKTTPIMIPKSRFDEVNTQFKESETRRLELEQREADRVAALTAPPRDFDAEFKALHEKYDAGDLNLDELRTEERKLQKEEIQATAAQIADQRLSEREQQRALEQADRDWKNAQSDWAKGNAEFLAKDGAKEALQSAILAVDQQTKGTLPPQELMKRAGVVAAALLGEPAPTPTPTPTDPKAVPHAARNAADAKAQSRAAATPAPLSGGMGDRGTDKGQVDLELLKPGKFHTLPKDEQDRLLGLVSS